MERDKDVQDELNREGATQAVRGRQGQVTVEICGAMRRVRGLVGRPHTTGTADKISGWAGKDSLPISLFGPCS